MSKIYKIQVIRAKDNTPYYYSGWDFYRRSHIFNENIECAKKFKDIESVNLIRKLFENVFWISILNIITIEEDDEND